MKRLIYILLLLPLLAYGQGTNVVHMAARPVVGGGAGGGASVDSVNWEQEWKDVYYTMAEADRPALDTADYYNTFVDSLKLYNYWSRFDWLYVLAQKTAAGGVLNMINPAAGTYDLVESGAGSLTFTPYRGYAGDGTNALLTNWDFINDPINSDSINVSIGAYILNNLVSETALISNPPPGTNTMYPRYTGDLFYYRINTNTSENVSNNNSQGLLTVVRGDASNTEAYKNGVSLGSDASTQDLVMDSDIIFINGTTYEVSAFYILDYTSANTVDTINIIFEQLHDRLGIGVQ